jgi:single-strand DNA-binding protein
MYHKLIIVGNLGRDPELRFSQDGNPVTTLSVATSRKYKDKDETTWFRVIVYGKQAESCNQYLTKGSKVLIEGRLMPNEKGEPRTYQDKAGVWRASFDVTAENVRFLSSKQDDEVEP